MAELTVQAYAKINLTLEVVRRLPSGYHELRTVFQQIALCDDLVLEDSNKIGLTCNDTSLAIGSGNLAWRAAALIVSRCCPQRAVHIHLHKRIPIGGGLGGGSADAAAVLVGLNRLWNLGLTRQELMALGAELGMDVPFCILGGTALGTGRGEDLTPLPPLPPLALVLAHPGTSVSTAQAYAGLRPHHMGNGEATAAMVSAISRGDMRAVAAGLYNVFEQSLMSHLPAIGRIKSLMLEGGAWNAALTGSGACVFALAGSPDEAEAIAAAVRREFPDVIVTRTREASETSQV